MTVSRVLNNKPDVSNATRQRIIDIIEKYQYKPHALARKLSTGKANIVGVALHTGGSYVEGLYTEVLQGLQTELGAHGFDVLLMAPPTTGLYSQRVLRSSLLDAVILMGNLTSWQDIMNLREDEIPFLTIGRREYGGYTPPFVAPNYTAAFGEATRLALARPAARVSVIISHLDGLNETNYAQIRDRLDGVNNVVDELGIPEDQVQQITSTGSFSDGYRYFERLTELPDSIILDSSEFSFGAVMALRDKGALSQTQLIGVDYENLIIRRCEDVTGITIPHWHINWLHIGKRAAFHLLSLMYEKPSSEIREYVDFERRHFHSLSTDN